MANRRAHSDLVTIVYPPGCREITDDLAIDELIRRLKTLAHTFQTLSQADDESTYSDYTPLAIHLADEGFLNHSSRDVQLLIACCIADILRIFAPEAPYKDPLQIRTIFYFLIKQLGGLKDPKDPAFKRYFYLLENLAYVKSFNMCFDLEECSEIFCALFQLMFKIVNDEHSGKVKSFMLDVLSPLLTEADFVSYELLDIILVNIVEPLKTQRKNAYMLAKELIIKTSLTLEPYIQQFFNQALILGKADVKLSISRKVYDLIYELNHICPRILLTVLPQLEFKLKSTEESERLGSVSLLARMFSERGSTLAQKHRQLWLAFLGRYNDISLTIRIKCVQYTMHFLLNHQELITDITETLKLRQHDSEENVRFEVVMAIVSTAKKDFDIVSNSEDLLNFVKERTLDKKFKIRKEANSGLAMIYKKQLTNPTSVPEATKRAVTWIKDKILHGYYMPGMEDRLLVEKLLNTCLVPYNLESAERMKKLFLLFATIDENASKAFIEVQKNQHLVRKCVTELLQLHRAEERNDAEIKKKIHATAKFLPEPVKATEFIRKLSQQMLTDSNLLPLMERVVEPDVSCAECMQAVTQILKKLGAPIMTNLYYGTVKQLLERVASVMVDRESIEHLCQFVKEALEDGPILQELGLQHVGRINPGERGLRLLLVLSFVFPWHFLHADIIRQIISLLSIKREPMVAPLALSVLTFVGKHQPLGDAFPDLLDGLVPICKMFIDKGTPKQAKQAVKCLYMNTTSTQETVFGEVLDMVKVNLDPSKGEAYLTAIVALGHIAFHLPEQFPVQMKNLVSRKIVKELLMQDRTETRPQDEEWLEEEDLPLETRCKMEGMKMMARWLLGLKDDNDNDKNHSVTISAQKTFRMLNAVVCTKGDLLEEGKPSPAERAWFRLSAGNAILKICEQKGVGDKYTLEQFYTFSQLFVDPIPQVRERILIKLHKGLGRGIPNKCLPLDFMGLFALSGLEQDKKLKNMARQFMIFDIGKRKDYVKTLMLSGKGDQLSRQLTRIMPDYMLIFAVPILAHIKDFVGYDNLDSLLRVQSALWFVMEPLISKNENFSFNFYKALIEKMKTHKDKLSPEDESSNYKLWAVCDLAMSLLISKTTNYELKEFPKDLQMPPMFFAPHEDPNFLNAVNYLPAQLIPKPPKKAGVSFHMPTQHAAQLATADLKAKITEDTTTYVVTADSDTSQTVLVEVSPLGENTDDIAAENHQLVQSTLLGQEENSQSGTSSSNGGELSGCPPTRKRGRPPSKSPGPDPVVAPAGAAAAATAVKRGKRKEEEPETWTTADSEESGAMQTSSGGTDAVEDTSAETSGRPRRSTRR